MNTFDNRIQKITVVTPHKYSAWPLIGSVRGKLVCPYTVADQHYTNNTALFMKTSDDNGVTWSEPEEIFTEKTGIKGLTGLGYNNQGDMLLWYRNGLPGGPDVTHQLYKYDGESITLVSTPDFALRGGHIGNIFRIEGKGLFAFYNAYGKPCSWGILKSCDEGVTWEQIPIEENLTRAECPVEIECAYVKDNKILALGRKDVEEGTVAMFQIKSSDYGETWTKEYTNVTDSYANSPSVIFDNKKDEVKLYYFVRFEGKLKCRTVNFNDVWNNPQNWSLPQILATETYGGLDTGNVKTVAVNGIHFCTYYAGTPTTTGVYGIIIKN